MSLTLPNYSGHEQTGKVILEGLRTKLVSGLVEQAIATIRPAVLAEAQRAVDDMNLTVESVSDIRLNRVLINLIVNPAEVKYVTR